MSEKTENKTASAKLGKFLENNRKPVIISFVIVLVLVIGFLCAEIIKTSVSKKDLAAVEGFYYELTAMSNEAEDSEITNKATECIENLAPYTKKGGIAGVRANMLSAELSYVLKDYDSAISYYSAAISKGKKSYTAPICYYNIGSCYEELNKLSDAVEAYKTAAEFDEFGMAPHAYFSQGRVLEAIGDFTGAAEAYNTLKSKFPEDSWSNLATTRLIELQIQGKAE